MSLFQKSVEKKYLSDLDSVLVDKKYAEFQDYFGNLERQENIRQAKEEQFQEGFLRELFVKIFGYTLNPELNFNLTTELKNIANSKKADGAILIGEDAVAVIELKSTSTPDLDTVESQAFGYKNHHPKCIYVITSNFEKLRFYIQNAVDYVDFDLFNLTSEDFSLLWLCLSKDNLLSGLPLKIKESSVLQEEDITKKLYADYSKFRVAIYNNLVLNNPGTDKLLLFKKTQKLLDRFLFIFFAEDRQLLPPNSISEIVKQWTTLKEELDEYIPLYDRFKKYFGYLNTGHKGKKYEIYAYNGGLFAPDEVLDESNIDDEILYQHILKLSNYDFDTEVDVNILGHIFEHSLGEIENVQAEIKGEKIDLQKTKRKKDGIYYTPKFITKYIVENTVGKLCLEKRIELEIIDEEYAKGRKNRKKDLIKALDDKLATYRTWLLSLTILDPACGSGAFLNQALDFLIEEHSKIDSLRAQLFEGGLVFSDFSTDILQRNIYGVDLNEESVEIAKLALWLRTAKKGRKLNTLSNNIKCGNSLIDDPIVAGEKAFNWHNEFPEIFSKGGFDVVIGNPPWGAKINQREAEILQDKYPVVPSKLKDTYMYFSLFSIDILKDNGILGLIVPNTWLLINNTSDYRKEILKNNTIEITDYGDGIFNDAIVESVVFVLTKSSQQKTKVVARKYRKEKELANQLVDKSFWLKDEFNRIVLEFDPKVYKIIDRINMFAKPFSDSCEIIFGIKPYQIGLGIPPQTKEVVESRIFHSNIQLDESWKPLVVGTDITRYRCHFPADKYIKYGKWLMYSSNELKILNPKILLRRTSYDIKAAFDENKYFPQNSVFIITSSLNLKYLLGLLNSSLINSIYKNKCPQEGKVFAEIKPSIIKALPLIETTKEKQDELVSLVDNIIELTKSFNNKSNKFSQYLGSQIKGLVLTSKLENWYDLEFSEFIKELNLVIKKSGLEKLSKFDEMEWMEVFESKKIEVKFLKSEIEKTDKEIDLMVYELYGLTEEEIEIVEGVE